MSSGPQHLIRLLDELARARGRMDAAFRDIRAMNGLTEVENVVLTAVTGAERPPTVPQIGRSLGHPRQVVQRAADILVNRGLLAWRDNPDHKRARLLTATPAGNRMRAEADRAGLERAGHVADGIETGLLAATVDGLRTIRERIEDNLRALGAVDATEREDA